MRRWMQRLASETLDVTLPARPENTGTVHPISQVLEEVDRHLRRSGFWRRRRPGRGI